jgi:hypothetical protein
MPAFLLIIASYLWGLSDTAPQPLATRTFDVAAPAEVVAVIHARCARCAWGETGREAAVLRLLVDGRYSQHLTLARGDADAEYRVMLGGYEIGHHQLSIEVDPAWSARGIGETTIGKVDFEIAIGNKNDNYLAASMAPVLHARANTVGRFTDLPILMWYEVVPTARGRQFRYSVIFTNEDGGTATDRLMATWGRTTDIEFVYGVELDAHDAVIAEEFQGPGHEVPPFKGRHEAKHPLLWVATDNNMVSDSGTTDVRYRLAPERFDLHDVSREVVMDAHPWSYALAAQEMRREGKVADDAAPGSGKIPDPGRFVFVEACTALENAAVAFAVRAKDAGGVERWYDSDRGMPAFRIVRTGCFRGAVPLPASAGRADAIRFRAFARPPQAGAAAPPGSVRVTRINKVFTLGPDGLPRPSSFAWSGSLPLALDGDWREVVF